MTATPDRHDWHDRPGDAPRPPRDLVDVIDEVGHARAEVGADPVEQDVVWASLVAFRLSMDGVATSAARRELRRVADVVRESGEGPEALFGTPDEFARQVQDDAAEAGEPLVDSSPDAAWRDVLPVGLTVAAGTSVLFAVVWLIRDGLTTNVSWGTLFAPGLVGVTGVTVMTLWERMLVRASRLVAVLTCAAALAAMACAIAFWLVEVNAGTRLFTGSTLWLFALTPAYGALAWLAEKMLPQAPPARTTSEAAAAGLADDAWADDAWAEELAGTLRLRMDLPEARVREIVREARAHAAESGRPLVEEFGAPARYAARFRRDRATASRRMAWLYTGMAALVLTISLGTFLTDGRLSWWNVAWVTVIVLVAAGQWREYRRQEAS